jgi:large subunit ribosomal protein L23
VKREIQDILVRPLLTEKAVGLSQTENTYAFEVLAGTNKIEIRKAVEAAFKVKVVKVRTAKKTGVTKRFGPRWVKNPDVRRAYVTLKEGDKIDLL